MISYEDFPRLQPGVIVKLYGSDFNGDNLFENIISEIIKPPGDRYGGACAENFTIRYGNEVRNEYSEMNFYTFSMLNFASKKEIAIYKMIPSVLEHFTENQIVFPFKSKIFNQSIEEDDSIIITSKFFNAYTDGIYTHGFDKKRDEYKKYKIWDAETFSFCSCTKEINNTYLKF